MKSTVWSEYKSPQSEPYRHPAIAREPEPRWPERPGITKQRALLTMSVTQTQQDWLSYAHSPEHRLENAGKANQHWITASHSFPPEKRWWMCSAACLVCWKAWIETERLRQSQLSLKPFPKVVINKSRRTSFFVFDQSATASSVTDLINVNVLFIWRCSLFQIRSDGLLLGLGSGGETKIPTARPMPHGVPRSFRGLRLNSLKPAELLNSTIPESES